MIHGKNFLVVVSVVFAAHLLASSVAHPSIAQFSMPESVTRIENTPTVLVALNAPIFKESFDNSRLPWNARQQSPQNKRSLQRESKLNHQIGNDNGNENDNDNDNDNTVNDSSKDETTNDDVTVVVPYNFARGENTDEGVYAKKPSLTTTTSAAPSSQKQRISWIVGVAVVCLIAVYILHRRRERARRREYRTLRILQEHVEAFDLNFRDEDDVELPSI